MSIEVGTRVVVTQEVYHTLPVGCPATVVRVMHHPDEERRGMVDVVRDGDASTRWALYMDEIKEV